AARVARDDAMSGRRRTLPTAAIDPRSMTPIRMQHAAIACLGLAAAGASIWAAPGAPGLLGAGLALLMLAIAVIDARHLIIPNELNAAALALALIDATVLAPSAVLEAFAAALSRGA